MINLFNAMLNDDTPVEDPEKMKRKTDFGKSLDNTITISKREFMDKASEVITDGAFMRVAKEHKPEMAITLTLAFAPVIAELTAVLFDKEDKKNGRE